MVEDVKTLIEENLRLTKENNRLLRKMKRAAVVGTFFRIIWIAVIIGLPLALYVYVLEPYYEGLRSQIGEFQEEVRSIPGLGGLFKAEE